MEGARERGQRANDVSADAAGRVWIHRNFNAGI